MRARHGGGVYCNAESLEYRMDRYFRHGQIDEPRPAEEMVDNQLLDYAIGVLGRYR